MKRYMRLMHKKGFSLVELVVVIAILGILASSVTLATINVIKTTTVNRNKNALRNYYTLSKGAMTQLNSGYSIYSNGRFTANADIITLLTKATGTEPVKLTRLEDDEATDKARPFASDREGYYVIIRYASTEYSYPLERGVEIEDRDRAFFVEAVYFVQDDQCYAFDRFGSEVTIYTV